MKLCTVCNVEKEESNFYFSKQYINNHCKECNSKKSKEWYSKNKEVKKRSALKHHFKKRYGITFEERETMLQNQGGKCIICSQQILLTSENRNKRAVIDHCHSSNKIRGMLCHLCNTGLGAFKDNISILSNAIKYLEKQS